MDTSPELETAVTTARAAGLPVERPQILWQGSSVIVLLAPGGPVARVGGLTAEVRDLRTHFSREVAIARYLADAGTPTARPAEPAGPHERDGRIVSFWARAAAGPPPDGEAVGVALRECHAALAIYPAALPPLSSLLYEARAVLASVELPRPERELVDASLERARERIARLRLPVQALHGDAGLGNCLPGPVWNDWEDCCEGPLAWDLACLVTTPRIQGRDLDRAEAALAAYGHAPGLEHLDAFVFARAAQIGAWSALSLARGRTTRERFARRLAWLAER